MNRTTTRRLAGMISAGLAGLLLIAACSGGSNTGSGAEPAIGRDQPQSQPQPGQSGQDSGSAGDQATEQKGGVAPRSQPDFGVDQTVLAPGDKLARRATLALKVKNLAQAADRVRSISAGADGIILSENIGSGDGGAVPLEDRSKVNATTYGEIAISVPVARLDAVLSDLSKLGTLIRRDSSTQNVTQQYADTEARLKTMRASVDRVRALMTKATDLTQIVNLESELSRRQADLESLEAQLAALKVSVERSPVYVSLTTDDGVVAAEPGEGFLAGIRAGWKAFTDSVVVLMTILGALLPFAVVLALLGLPLAMMWRRRQPKGASTPTPAAPATP